jgi:hypothetical protein
MGRIGTRAALIALLMLAVVGLLTGSAIMLAERQIAIIERMGGPDEEADAMLDRFATQIADFTTAMSNVLAGVLRATPAASRMVRTGTMLGESFAAVDRHLGAEIDPIVMSGARDSAARLGPLVERVRDAFAANRSAEFAGLQEEWLDAQASLQAVLLAARRASAPRGWWAAPLSSSCCCG